MNSNPNPQEVRLEALSPHLKTSVELLTPDELRELQEIADLLKVRCDLISPITWEYEERLAVATMPRRCKECVAIQLCPEWTFLPKYQAKVGCFPSAQNRYTSSMTDEEKRSRVTDCLNRIGRRGHSGNNPIAAILYDMRTLIGKIETLPHTGFLRTKRKERQ